MNRTPLLHLASTSPRRREILVSLGLEFTVVPVDVDETPRDGETPAEMVLRLAVAKAEAARVPQDDVVIGSDTAVVVDGRALGKPMDRDDCLAMLESLAGRAHTVLTGVALSGPHGALSAMSETEVRFRDIDRDEMLAYWQSGEPRDKAGAYAIQGLGGAFVERIAGSYSGVVGLPVFETAGLLEAVGIDILAPHDDL
ncbi:MAG: septum formation inhibitor Maf [Gammaproteobacteria bacterium]|nr:septum formation inhibitor Maf [Gammaproteobacteria bacterium]NNF49704.1 septum formation inhibitor Maf [Woeseiaceae bacterium]MBT8093989.1 septum formation inhibitor Maf [Gammaproteobacteria bacterium]MBT8105276.1 septum formation inhibitor Maf [Gammaproteobacteria bacterium]NNK25290.1 septum formation inhibitor Maf [Woeseiaceae bacterium]